MADVIKLVIADDHAIVRDGLKRLLDTQPDFVVVGEASNGLDALQRAQEIKPDLLLLDLNMPGLSGLDVIAEIKRTMLPMRIILLVASIDRAETIRALQFGAQGIVLKEAATELLFKAIRSVMAGQYWVGHDTVSDLVQMLAHVASTGAAPAGTSKFGLTRRELEVLGLVVAGSQNKDIAAKFSLSEHTVKHHLTNIFDKTGASNRLELALFAIHHQLILPAAPNEP
jgi:two-component system, NarL family, nitrate/nitrite response regulator NarL